MSDRAISRRQILKMTGVLALALPVLQACGGGANAPAATSAPANAPAAAQAAATATTAPASQAAPSGGKVAMAIGTEGGDALNWQRELAKQWADKNPDVDLRIDTITYSESEQKTSAALAAGTLQDVVYASCKWFPLPAFKGAYRDLGDYIKTKDPGMDDIFPGTIANSKFDGKLYGLPNDFDNGNYSIVLLNLDLFNTKGVKPPAELWSVTDFVDTVAKLTDRDNKVYGTDYLTGTYYDFSQVSRTWGTEILSEDGKKFQFATDPKSTEGARWVTELRTKNKVAPLKADLQGVSQGIGFASGKLATSFVGIYDVLTTGDAVGNKFKWDATLFPKGPTGNHSFYEFSSAFTIFAKSKAPEKAYDLLLFETSKEAGIYGVVKSHFAPNPRISVFEAPEIKNIHPVFPRLLEWLKNPSGKTNFPLPWNLRYAELQDKWSNTTQPLFYGDTPFEQAMKAVQDACQSILDKPRP
jgi:multiple sugar transport system substrate-binding protein